MSDEILRGISRAVEQAKPCAGVECRTHRFISALSGWIEHDDPELSAELFALLAHREGDQ